MDMFNHFLQLFYLNKAEMQKISQGKNQILNKSFQTLTRVCSKVIIVILRQTILLQFWKFQYPMLSFVCSKRYSLFKLL